MDVILISHFHWDREWYRSFQEFRARLVDAVDAVLDLLARDPEYRFVLDGQAIVLEDYLAIRPERRAELERGVLDGRLAIGPWYVQPDSLLPSGEAHVRNLLHGRCVGRTLGPVSTVAYLPDSFGHPAQLPQLFADFGLTSFVYWRGNGDEIDALGSVYRWLAPDGSEVTAHFLQEGYFGAACLPEEPTDAAIRLAEIVQRLGRATRGPVILMNGFDHMLPDAHVGAVAEALAAMTGTAVHRGLLEDAVARHAPSDQDPASPPSFSGNLIGARVANLLPGVWSARLPLKLRNRRCETLLEGWAEPWAALGRLLKLPDERHALTRAWRALLENQAHDSIGGCSIDAVHERMAARYEDSEGLARETTTRVLQRIAGLGRERRVPWSLEQEVAVFNPSPHPRTDVVRVPLDAYPPLLVRVGQPEAHPLQLTGEHAPGFEVDGRPVRVVPSEDPARVRFLPGLTPFDLEFVAEDLPAFGYRRYRATPAAPECDDVDDGSEIEGGSPGAPIAVRVDDNGTLTVGFGGSEHSELQGLLAIEDRGDRGDSYDFDPLDDDPGAMLVSVSWRRRRHRAGLNALEITRVFAVPAALDASRERRSSDMARITLTTEVSVARGVDRVDLRVKLDNQARDHRMRLLFPSGRSVSSFQAASTFDVAERSTKLPDASRWVHSAPATFPHQGWISAGGLTVVAPGLPEAEVTADGVIAVTLLRAVGWLARFDLCSRPIPAGPQMPAPGAQLQGVIEARLGLLPRPDAGTARDAELGLWGVIAGPQPSWMPDRALLALEPDGLVLSAVKPAESGDGIVVRVLNPTGQPLAAVLRPGFAVSSVRVVRLDEEPAEHAVTLETTDPPVIRFDVPAHALRSVQLA